MQEVFKKRKEYVERLKKGVDVLIVGGGITGAGVFNTLSSLDLDVALIDANDFAFGTSSRSSKLIHGGLRYLANGQFSVVRDSVRERDFLLENSDIVKREDFFIPLDDFSWKRYTLGLGLWLYSFFSKNIKAKWYSREEIIKKYPYLEKTPQRGGYVYAEGVVDDSRLVIENIMSGKMRNRIAINYAQLVSIDFEGNEARSAVVRDKITGEEFKVNFKVLINSAGPWVGDVFKMMKEKFNEIDELSGMLKLSKGDHIVVKRDLFPPDIAIALRSPIDKRQVFIIPRGEVVIIGTTETYYNGSLEDPRPSEREIEYLIESVKRYINITRQDIINAYSGIRPLFGKGEDLGKISREYRIIENENIINILGGKITTYRTVSKKISKLVMEKFSIRGEPELNFIYKRNVESFKKEFKERYSINDDEMEFAYDIINEDAYYLDDILWRREGYFIFKKDSGLSAIDTCINSMKKVLGYDENRLIEEKKRYIEMIYNNYKV